MVVKKLQQICMKTNFVHYCMSINKKKFDFLTFPLIPWDMLCYNNPVL